MAPWSLAIKTVGRRAPAPGQTGSKSGEDVNPSSAASHNSHSSGSNSSSGGGGSGGRNNCNHNHADSGESNFTIEVDPDDPLHILNERIERVTGLAAEQQRLIYRGRIISGGNNSAANNGGGGGAGRRELTEAERLLGETDVSDDHADASSPSASAAVSSSPDANNERDENTPRVRDVKGLCDNQTIHLVPRPAGNTINSASDNRGNNSNNNSGMAGGLGGGLGDFGDGGPGGLFDLGEALGGLAGLGGTGGGGNNVTQLSGVEGMNLLAALLGASAGVGGAGTSAAGAANNNGGGTMSGVAGSTEGLGGVVERAAQMGVLGEAGAGAGPTILGGAAGGDASSLLSALTSTGLGGFSSGTAELNDTNATPGTARTRQARENDTFPRLAPLGNAARRTASRRHRNPNASAAARARASAARLTEADIRVPDPGSAEPVRQGLLTLHTLLGNAELDRPERPTAATDSLSAQPRTLPPIRAPLDSHRRWYRGQWLDALDTVHQWLEATVVDVVSPSDILPNYSLVRSHVRNNDHERRTRRAAPDAVVSANDLEGRRRLLLEPLPDEHDFFASHDESDILYDGMRPRPDNHNVQILLIHYNGWPHRWDEWIRSDSERLRPFRTRSRHRTNGGAGHVASPTPNAVFPSAPSTVIGTEEDDVAERGALLEEVHRVLGRAERLVGHAIARSEGNGAENGGSLPVMPVDGGVSPTAHLPWRQPSHRRPSPPTDTEEEGSASSDGATCPPGSDWRHRLDAARLRQLAPILDRLGRMLTDAAPQVAALADSLPPPPTPMATFGEPSADVLPADGMTAATSDAAVEELAAQASHLYFGLGEEDREPNVNHPVAESAAAALSSLLSGEDGVAAMTASSPTGATGTSSVASSATVPPDANMILLEEIIEEETTAIIDPDLTDYIDGMVNTSRGPGGMRGLLEGGSGEAPGTSLLAQYLRQLGGGSGNDNGGGAGGSNTGGGNTRTIRMGGGNGAGAGPGIDIHIHAIVTGPGMAGGDAGLGLDGVGGLGTAAATATPRNNRTNRAAFGTTTPTNNDDDGDLFSELYSESPQPVNPHGEDETRIVGIREDTGGDDLNLMFEECRSIEEEDSSDEEEVAATGAERAASALELTPFGAEMMGLPLADLVAPLEPITATAVDPIAVATANIINRSESSRSMLALSEIESQESSATSSPTRPLPLTTSGRNNTTGGAAAPTLQSSLRSGASSTGSGAARSPSFARRLFRRTFGRLSISRRSNRST